MSKKRKIQNFKFFKSSSNTKVFTNSQEFILSFQSNVYFGIFLVRKIPLDIDDPREAFIQPKKYIFPIFSKHQKKLISDRQREIFYDCIIVIILLIIL